MRTLIGLLVAVAIIISLGFGLHSLLEDYLIDNGTSIPDLDWERFVYDTANHFVDYLYASRTVEPAPTESPTELTLPE